MHKMKRLLLLIDFITKFFHNRGIVIRHFLCFNPGKGFVLKQADFGKGVVLAVLL